MPQPDLIGKPTPSVCLSCYFLGSNELSFLTYSPKLGLVVANFLQFSPAMVPLHLLHKYKNFYLENKYIKYEISINIYNIFID